MKKISSYLALFLSVLFFSMPFIATAGLNSWSPIGPAFVGTGGSYRYACSMDFSSDFANNGKIFLADELGYLYTYNKSSVSWSNTALPSAAYLETIAVALNDMAFVASSNGYRVYRSSDSGNTWVDISRFWQSGGVPFNAHWKIGISPNFLNDNTVFIAGNYGVIRSTDRGNNWAVKSSGLPSGSMLDLVLSPAYQFSSNQPIFAGGYGLYRSTNNGDTWEVWKGNLPNSPSYDRPYVNSLAISPGFATDQTLFAAVENQGFYKSSDGGQTWSRLNIDPIYSLKIVISPNYTSDRTIFLKGSYNATNYLMVSTDAGATWKALQSLPYTPRIIAISPNFANDKTIYAGLQGPTAEITSALYAYTIGPSNQAPTANAGTPQTVHVGFPVTLDGSGSSDPDGDTITYAWSIVTRPISSTAALSNTSVVNPAFVPDVPGDYIIELVVTDNSGLQSEPASVAISTTNTPPIAEAGEDQSVQLVGSIVSLNGTQSYDGDGDPITYAWQFTSRPAGSNAALNGANTVFPTFTPDVYGTYTVRFVVSDPWAASDPDFVTISFENVKPVADPGTSQSTVVFQAVALDGGASWDANGDSLTYHWSLLSYPQGSVAAIVNPTAEVAAFTPDVEGTYVIQLVVSDGIASSDPKSIQIEAVDYLSTVIDSIQASQAVVTTIPPAGFKNSNMQNTLLNKLNAVIASIQAGNYSDALAKLENDILNKTDGCAITGSPDKNDWVKNCADQNRLYSEVVQTIELLKNLMN